MFPFLLTSMLVFTYFITNVYRKPSLLKSSLVAAGWPQAGRAGLHQGLPRLLVQVHCPANRQTAAGAAVANQPGSCTWQMKHPSGGKACATMAQGSCPRIGYQKGNQRRGRWEGEEKEGATAPAANAAQAETARPPQPSTTLWQWRDQLRDNPKPRITKQGPRCVTMQEAHKEPTRTSTGILRGGCMRSYGMRR